MKTAYCLIREDPVYRRAAFVAGLRACGYTVQGVPPSGRVREGDVLIIWNRYGSNDQIARMVDEQGGVVLVAENGYLANDRANRTRYAIARDGHNGSGCWPVGGGERWAALGVPLAPWRTQGTHVLVCPNRPFGTPAMTMPTMWAERTADLLAAYTKRPVRIRKHPGNGPHPVPLVRDLADAWAVVVWSSSVGCEALVRGIPVHSSAPHWICKSACFSDLKKVDNPVLPDRLPAFNSLAWAQWHISEIERGDPFQYLLNGPSAFGGGL